jgi:hypothetical protein
LTNQGKCDINPAIIVNISKLDTTTTIPEIGVMPTRSSKRPRDANQLAKRIIDIATGQIDDEPDDDEKNPAAVALGKLGGHKGGVARAKRLTPEQRRAIAVHAATIRWERKRGDE